MFYNMLLLKKVKKGVAQHIKYYCGNEKKAVPLQRI